MTAKGEIKLQGIVSEIPDSSSKAQAINISDIKHNNELNYVPSQNQNDCINKISEWIVIIICIAISFYFNAKLPYKQCISGQDLDCSVYSENNIIYPNPNIAYPKKKSSVSFKMLNIICPIIWAIIFFINVFIINYYHSLKSNKLYCKILLIKAEILFRSVSISVSFTALTTDIMKCMIGRPRPNYLNNDDEINATQSFPSGHASYIFANFFILTLYLGQSLINARKIMYFYRVNIENKIGEIITFCNGDSYFFLWLFLFLKKCQILCLLIVITPSLIAIYVACSRLTDYKHYYSDVLAGAIIGIFYSFLSFIYCKSEFYSNYQYVSV